MDFRIPAIFGHQVPAHRRSSCTAEAASGHRPNWAKATVRQKQAVCREISHSSQLPPRGSASNPSSKVRRSWACPRIKARTALVRSRSVEGHTRPGAGVRP